MSRTPTRLTRTACVVFAALLLTASAARAAGPGKDLVKPQLLADVASVQPGSTFTVGVLLDVAAGWHVYWTNPGDSGLAPTVKFKLPEGFTAGPLRFPTPERFTPGADQVAYGYGGSVMLTASVKAPADLKPDAPVAIGANLSWLVCSEACVPGKGKVELSLPVSKDAAPADERTAKLFRQWSARLPADAADSPDVAKLEWAADPKPGTATLTVTWKGAARAINLFPTADDSADVRTTSAQDQGNKTTITVSVRPLAGRKARTDPLPAVLGYTAKEGERRGVKTDVPAAAFAAAPGKETTTK